jgi:hypothetical protein
MRNAENQTPKNGNHQIVLSDQARQTQKQLKVLFSKIPIGGPLFL